MIKIRILAIDHASRTGYAVLDDGKLVTCGCRFISSGGAGKGYRLFKMYDAVAELINTYKPDIIALEQPKDRTNANTVLTLIGYYCMAQYCAHMHGVPVNEVNPKQMKKVVTGNGNADKDMMLEYISMRLGVDKDTISPIELYKVGAKKGQFKSRYYDESDACALAYFTWIKCRKEKYNE
jgi:crossover junction endodeoxyribonuclease RuvC